MVAAVQSHWAFNLTKAWSGWLCGGLRNQYRVGCLDQVAAGTSDLRASEDNEHQEAAELDLGCSLSEQAPWCDQDH